MAIIALLVRTPLMYLSPKLFLSNKRVTEQSRGHSICTNHGPHAAKTASEIDAYSLTPNKITEKTTVMTEHKKSTSLLATAAILMSCFAIVGETQGKGRKKTSKAAISVKQVNPRAVGYQTTERGGWDEFQVVLKSQPTDTVSISLYSDDTFEGIIDQNELVFTPANWDTPQIVWVIGVNDEFTDGNVGYTIVLEPASSADPNYNGLDPEDVQVINIDDDTEQTLNFEPVLYGEVYGPLRDLTVFNQVRLDAETCTLVWPNDADFDPWVRHEWPRLVDKLAERAQLWVTEQAVAI